MPTNLPKTCFMTALALWALLNTAPLFLPQAVFSGLVFRWTILFSLTLALSLTSFFSLCGLVLQTFFHRQLVGLFLGGLGGFVFILATTFSKVFALIVVLTVATSVSASLATFPGLVDKASHADTEAHRKEAARGAYLFHGAVVAYRLDNGSQALYQPVPEDEKMRKTSRETDQKMAEAIGTIQGKLSVLVCTVTGVLGLFFLTFTIGGIWLYFRIPKTEVWFECIDPESQLHVWRLGGKLLRRNRKSGFGIAALLPFDYHRTIPCFPFKDPR